MKGLLIIIALIIAVGAIWMVVGSSTNDSTSTETPQTNTGSVATDTPSDPSTISETPAPGITNISETIVEQGNANVGADEERPAAITVSSTGASPQTLTVPAGTTVTWTNAAGRSIYVAPDLHPTHLQYAGTWDDDGTGRISDGGTYSYTFTQAGTYSWHDHLRSSVSGTVTVQ